MVLPDPTSASRRGQVRRDRGDHLHILALLEEISESADTEKKPGQALTGCYDELVDAGVRTRIAATLTGLSKATQDRRRRPRCGPVATPAAAVAPVPVNKLTDAEAAEVVAVLNSQRFVDKAPPQIYATLLAEGDVPVFDLHDVPDPGAESRR